MNIHAKIILLNLFHFRQWFRAEIKLF